MLQTIVGGQIYGELRLDIQMDCESNQSHMALLEGEMRVSDYSLASLTELNVTDPITGQIIAKLKVNAVQIEWQKFYSVDE